MHVIESLPFDPVYLDRHARLVDKLAELYAVMDQHYQTAADHYGFICTGCEDNCCYTRFYHHTVVEYGFLRKGFKALDPVRQRDLQHRAVLYSEAIRQIEAAPANQRPMCPLNENSRCILYAHRPMICRLHGLPHKIRKSGAQVISGSGCHFFEEQCGAHDEIIFDRTPLYHQMAILELELRQVLNLTSKIKMTVAEMVSTF